MPRCCLPPTRCFILTDPLEMMMKEETYPRASGCSGPGAPPVNRRELLQRMCAGFGSVGLAGMLGEAQAGTLRADLAAASRPKPHYSPKAKRVIFLFMNGGPSHVDTFD